MNKYHISFYGRKNGEKLKLHHETVIKASEPEAIESLGINYANILVKSIGCIPLVLITYGALYKLTPHVYENAKRNLQRADGSRYYSKFINAADPFILFEKTIREDKSEYYSNAWSGEWEAIDSHLKDFKKWVDYRSAASRIVRKLED